MCIAIGKMAGQALPSEEIIRNCWESNDDGAGFAFAYNGAVYIKKGFMTLDSFITALNECDKRYNLKECGMLMHFRIATHGGTIPSMTHPFPIVADNGALQKLEYCSDFAVVHNGIISLTSAKAHAEKGMSDTAVFIRDYLSLIAQNKSWFKRRANMELIDELIGSKMAILNRFGEIVYTNGFQEDNGIMYSNGTYKTMRVRAKNYPTNYSYYSEDEGYYGSYTGNYNKGTGYKGTYDRTYYGNYNSSSVSVTVPLMKAVRGDTVEGDSVSENITSENEGMFLISKEGYLYARIREGMNNNDYKDSYEFIGSGFIYDIGIREKPFTPNAWVYDDQFLGDESPAEINKCFVDDSNVGKDDNGKKKETEKNNEIKQEETNVPS